MNKEYKKDFKESHLKEENVDKIYPLPDLFEIFCYRT